MEWPPTSLTPSDQQDLERPPTSKTSSPVDKAKATEITRLLCDSHDQGENKSEIQIENKSEIDTNSYGSFKFDLYQYRINHHV